MRFFKFLAAAVLSLCLQSSCSVVKNLAANNPSTAGAYAGEAIAALATVLQQNGTIDLSSITNIINLGRVITGATAATKTKQSFVDTFTRNLIGGSGNLINSSNVGSVISGLKTLAGMDTSALAAAATTAAMTGKVPALSTSNSSVSGTMSQLTSILGLLK